MSTESKALLRELVVSANQDNGSKFSEILNNLLGDRIRLVLAKKATEINLFNEEARHG